MTTIIVMKVMIMMIAFLGSNDNSDNSCNSDRMFQQMVSTVMDASMITCQG